MTMMERQKITLSIPRETIKIAKLPAVAKDRSLSGLLTEYIETLVNNEDTYEQAHQQQLLIMEKGLDFGLEGSVG
jgi:hypothetical protein